MQRIEIVMKIKKPFKKGVALVVSGPSGAGKSTICQALIEDGGLGFSISCTTRKPRPGERDGVDYFFISRSEFERRLAAGDFLEHAEVHGNYYGTLTSEVMKRVDSGDDVLLDIDVQGALQMRERCAGNPALAKSAEFVFIGPPNFAELERRLRARGTETEELIERRLENARWEMEHWRDYDFLIINKDIDRTINDMRHLLDILHKRTIRLEDSGFYD